MKFNKLCILALIFTLISCAHYGKVERQFYPIPSFEPGTVMLFNGFDQQPNETMLAATERIFKDCDIKVVNQFGPKLDEDFQKAGFPVTERDIDSDIFIDRMKMVYGITHIIMARSYNPETDWHIQVRNIENKSPLFLEVYDLSQEKIVSGMLLTSRTIRSPFPVLGVKNESKGTLYISYNNGLRKIISSCR